MLLEGASRVLQLLQRSSLTSVMSVRSLQKGASRSPPAPERAKVWRGALDSKMGALGRAELVR